MTGERAEVEVDRGHDPALQLELAEADAPGVEQRLGETMWRRRSHFAPGRHDPLHEFCRGRAGIVGLCDGPRHREQHAHPVGAQACGERRFERPALGTDAGGEDPVVGCDGADLRDRPGLRRPHHQTDPVRRPSGHGPGDADVQRLTRRHRSLLQFCPTWVRRATEHEEVAA